MNRTDKTKTAAKAKKLFISLLTILCIVVSVSGAYTASALEEIWDGTVADSFESGTGTKDDPFIIYSASQLAYLASTVNGGETYEGKYISLASDLFLNGVDSQGGIVAENVWTPIGKTASNAFCGVFDGCDHKITGLYTSAISNGNGLFGVIAEGGQVKNLCVSASLAEGRIYVGAICSVNNGVIYNCAAIDSTVAATSSVGGICGINNGDMSYCSFSGDVSASTVTGGICGDNRGIITAAETSGAVTSRDTAGGICGVSSGELKECTNKAVVSGSGDCMGGICGRSDSGAKTERSVNTGSISGDSSVSGICGEATDSIISDCYNIGSITAVNYYAGGICGKTSSCNISTCFSTGGINAGKFVGAICGKASDDTVFSYCYYLYGSAIDSRECVQNGVGCDTRGSAQQDIELALIAAQNDEMRISKTYEGFDTENIWRSNDGALPQLISNILDPGQIAHYHNIKSTAYPVTCESNGYTEHRCTVCGRSRIDSVIQSTGHSLIHHDAKEPTTDEPGWNAYDECQNCGYTTYIEIPRIPAPNDESFEDISNEPVSKDEASTEPVSDESSNGIENTIDTESEQSSDESQHDSPAPVGISIEVILIAAGVLLLAGIAALIIILRNRRYRNWR